MFNRPGGRSKGVTLIEMMIVVVLLAILSALAAPSLFELIIRNRLDTTINDFVTTLSLARSEAIRRGTNVVVRRAAGSTLQEWTKGWEVFQDTNGNNLRDTGEELILIGQAINAPLTLWSSRNTQDHVAFRPSGAAAEDKPYIFALCYGSVLVSADGRPRSRGIMVIGLSGRIRSATPNEAGKLIKDTATGTAEVTSCTSP